MARVTDGIGKFLSGSIEGMVFVEGKYGTYMRSMPRARKANEWSKKQKETRNGFRSVIQFAAKHKNNFVIPIWNKAAGELNMSGFNLFVKANRPAFDAKGNLSNPELIHFSTGPLILPYRLWAEADEQKPGSIAVTWIDQLAGSDSAEDCLMAYIDHDRAKGMVNTGFKRKDQRAEIAHPTPDAGDVFLSLFFWNEKLDIYSPDQVFKV
jgi:hypothetical protein